MENETLDYLAREWTLAKEAERQAIDARREIEDKISATMHLKADQDGTVKLVTPGGITIKTVGRLNRKINMERLFAIAHANNRGDLLETLFRWKPEINTKAWESAPQSDTSLFNDAITTTPGRPSYYINIGGNENE